MYCIFCITSKTIPTVVVLSTISGNGIITSHSNNFASQLQSILAGFLEAFPLGSVLDSYGYIYFALSRGHSAYLVFIKSIAQLGCPA